MNIKHAIIAAGVVSVIGTSAFAADVLVEDFEDATVGYTTSFPEAGSGTDYFKRTDTSGILATFSGVDGSFFAAQDLDNVSGGSSPATLTFSGIDISTFTDLMFSIDLAEDDEGSNEDWDNSDSVVITYSIDGGVAQNLLAIENDGSTFNSAPFIDTNFDGDGEGAEITDTFTTFSSSIIGTGSSMSIVITFSGLTANDEDIAFDNLTVTGTVIPEPLTVSAGLLGIGGIMLRRRSAV
ncbi:MAG: hypothetical protein AAF656_01725 [Planctomycetota bacterium]